MRLVDLLRLILENLSRHKGRVLLTAIGVIIGTAAVVVLVSLGIGLQKSATENLWGISDLTRIEVNPVWEDMYAVEAGGKGDTGSSSQQKKLTPAALEEIAALPGVASVIPLDYLMGWGQLTYGKMEYWANFVGVDPEKLPYLELEAAVGDVDLQKGTVIIGSQVPMNYYDPNYRPGQEVAEPPDLMGQQLKLVMTKYTSDGEEIKKTLQLRVVGILEETQGESDWSMYVTMSQLDEWNTWFNGGKRINRNKDGYQRVIVKAESVEYVTDLTNAINEMGFQAFSPQSMVEGVNSYFMVLQIVFGGIGAIALLVAAIGIANTMTMAILERTHEIGLMKAIGATNNDVLRIFLGEAAGIGFIGGLGGAFFGWLFSKAFNVVATSILASQMQQGGGFGGGLSTSTPPWLLLFALLFATFIGVASGFFPAVNATRLEPVKALKYE
ncbi:MAG: ABC transporter permease [Anaerolineae bacterium]|nr:ABC transporter permease [Anaerolineae bacterium]